MADHINQNPDVQMTLQQRARSLLIDQAAQGELHLYKMHYTIEVYCTLEHATTVYLKNLKLLESNQKKELS